MFRKVSKRKAFAVSVISFALCPILIYSGINPSGAPERTSLATAGGVVEWSEANRYSIRFKLAGHDAPFVYLSKGGKMGPVKNGLRTATRLPAQVLFDPEASSGPVWRSDKAFPVYELRVGAATVVSLAEVDAAWRSDNRLALWLGIVFAALGVYLALYSRRAP